MTVDYNDIAQHYDCLVEQDIAKQTFPYSGYQMIQDLITDDISNKKKKVKVLDLGCGTGKLYEHINPNKFSLTGIDISSKMLDIAKKKYPNQHFYHYDILKGLPSQIKNQSFDYIIINYLMMHYSFKTTIDIIHFLIKRLNKQGRIIVGDLLVMNPSAKQEFFYQHQEFADLDLHFHMYSQYVNKMSEQLALSFFEINDYTGMMIIENINEFTLHFEDDLVKYKSNTVKWKSTHPRRKRE
jgi:putative AdoMet-dependent methyltransferase